MHIKSKTIAGVSIQHANAELSNYIREESISPDLITHFALHSAGVSSGGIPLVTVMLTHQVAEEPNLRRIAETAYADGNTAKKFDSFVTAVNVGVIQGGLTVTHSASCVILDTQGMVAEMAYMLIAGPSTP